MIEEGATFPKATERYEWASIAEEILLPEAGTAREWFRALGLSRPSRLITLTRPACRPVRTLGAGGVS